MPRGKDSIYDKNQKFVTDVNKLLDKLELQRSELGEKASERLTELQKKVEEQQNVVLPKLQRAMSKLEIQKEEAKKTATPLVRKAVTGKEDFPIEEWLEKYKVVKLLDKLTFVGGVLFLQATQYMAQSFPEFFRFYFAAASIFLIGLRLHLYQKDNMHYFLLDYCYMTNLICIVNALFLPKSWFLGQICFVSTHGPLLWAIIAWRNSMVFHSMDKVTSIYIHAVPAMNSYVQRWNLQESTLCQAPGQCKLTFASGFLAPFLIYCVWQALYLVQTEVIDKHKFDNDPTLMTSLRFIVKSKRNIVHQLILKFGRMNGFLGEDEELDINKQPTLIISIFVGFQCAFTIATFSFTPIWFNFRILNRMFFVVVWTTALWNGANFYFEVFAKRYEAGLKKAEEKRKGRKSSATSQRNSRRSLKGGLCAAPNAAEREQLKKEASEVRRRKSKASQPEEEEEPIPL